MAVERYQRKDGSWCFLASYYGPDGIKRREKVCTLPAGAGEKAQKRAEERARVTASERRASVENGTWTPKEESPSIRRDLTFADLAAAFLAEYRTPRGNIEFHRHRVTILNRTFGSRCAGSITQKDVEAFRDARLESCTPTTVHHDLAIIGQVFKWGIKHRLCRENPVSGVRRPQIPPRAISTISLEDETRLLEASPRWLARILRFAVLTGGDRLDIVTLVWSAVDQVTGVIWLPRSKTQTDRSIPLTPAISEIISECRRTRTLIDPRSRVFNGPEGRLLTLGEVDRAARKAYRAIGLPDAEPFRRLRHTFASRCVRSGRAGVHELRALLGHRTLEQSIAYVSVSGDRKAEILTAIEGQPASEGDSKKAETPNTAGMMI